MHADLYRVYLDNFDYLRKVAPEQAAVLEGDSCELVELLRDQYSKISMPRNEGKTVQSASDAEVQGAWILGKLGRAYAKPDKLCQYVQAAWALSHASHCSKRQAQVVGGGLVYVSTFRRPLLGLLNYLWEFIRRFEETSVRWMPVPKKVTEEIHTFLSLLPLARIDFRLPFCELVTCSDASNTGGGICASTGLSEWGKQAAMLPTLSELSVTAKPTAAVLGIGINDGIGALRVAMDLLGTDAAGYISIEPDSACRRVVASHYGATIFHESVASVDADLVRDWACKFPSVAVVVVGVGLSSCLQSQLGLHGQHTFHDIANLVRVAFPWASVHCLLEGGASMKTHVRTQVTQMMGVIPFQVDAIPLAPCHRRRLFWVDWPLYAQDGLTLFQPIGISDSACGTVEFDGGFPLQACLERKCTVSPNFVAFPCFTAPHPRTTHSTQTFAWACEARATKKRWAGGGCRFPPHHYESRHCVITEEGLLRLPSVLERERMMGSSGSLHLAGHEQNTAKVSACTFGKYSPLHAGNNGERARRCCSAHVLAVPERLV